MSGSRADSSTLTVGLEDGLVLRQLKTPEAARTLIKVLGDNRRSAQQALK
jgi:hypothetical protein